MAVSPEQEAGTGWAAIPVAPVEDVRALYAGMERALAWAGDSGAPLVVAYVGLGSLLEKTQATSAEALLCRTAAAIRQALDDGDMIGRAGDDGLVVVLPGSTRAQAVGLMMRAQRALYALLPPGLRDKASFSYGLTECIGCNGGGRDTVQRLVAKAAGDMTLCLERCQNS